MKEYRIAVAGMGYVGLSVAILLAQHHEVCAVDVIPERVELLNRKKSPIIDIEIEEYLATKQLSLYATINEEEAYSRSDFVVIAVPTNYNSERNLFDTSAVEQVISSVIKYNPKAFIIIKSTVPVGYTQSIRKKYKYKKIAFSPEFLREGKALHDNLYPSRIIVGTDLADNQLLKMAKLFAQ